MVCHFCGKKQRGRMAKATVEYWFTASLNGEPEPERDWKEVYACKKCKGGRK